MKINKSSIILLLFLFLPVFSIISSCAPEIIFGELIICEEIDSVTFAPLAVKDDFKIDAEKIYVAIEVTGVRGDDTWRFTWTNIETGEVLADAANLYSSDNKDYVQGYLSNYIIPGSSGSIIGEPGSYRVDFYHNSILEGSSEFTIEAPEAGILDVVLTGEVDDSSEPSGPKETFYPEDRIFIAVKLNYRLIGDELSIKWYDGEEMLLGESRNIIEEDIFTPGYIAFEAINANELPWPYDNYKVEVYHRDKIFESYNYEVIPEPIPEHAFQEENIYKNTDIGFSIIFPDNWKVEESEDEAGLKINFIPLDEEMNVAMDILVYNDKYYPPKDEYSDFADEEIIESITSADPEKLVKTESDVSLDNITYKEIEFLNNEDGENGVNITMSFIENDKKLFLFIKVSDLLYMEFAEKVYVDMLESLSFD